MAWECHNRFWHGTRTYMMSGRTNPTPTVYTATLTANEITQAEKAGLIQCVLTWPGARNRQVALATADDIRKAQTVD